MSNKNKALESKRIFKNIDDYISALSEPHQTVMQTLRQAIKGAAPEAVEVISYNMPAFKIYGKILVYFAAHTNHIGFYPAEAAVIGLFKDELVKYNTSKGTIQFPLDKPIPAGLVKKIVKMRTENIKIKKTRNTKGTKS